MTNQSTIDKLIEMRLTSMADAFRIQMDDTTIKEAAEFFSGFSGYLKTDCYQGYDNLPGVKRCCCWAHLRRYFLEAVPKGKELD